MADLSLRYLLFGSDVTASKVFREVGENAKKASEKIDGSADHTSGKMGKLAKVAGGALLGIAGAAVGVGVASLEMADDFESSHVRLEGAIVNAGGNFEEYSKQVAATNKTLENLGYTNADTESSLATLTNAVHNPAKAMSQMSLAADISRGRNISLADATSILVKVNTGHIGLLSKLGLQTKDATGKTLTQTQAVAELAKMYGGDAKRTADSFAGRQALLKTQLVDTGAKIGMALIPILSQLTNFVINSVIPTISSMAKWIKKNSDWLIPLVAILGTAAAAIYIVVTAVKVWTAVEEAFNLVMDANPIIFVILAIAALVVGVIYAYNHFTTFRNIVNGVFTWLKTTVTTVIDFVRNHWQLILAILTGPFGLAVYEIRQHWATIKQDANKVVQFFAGIPTAISNALGDLGNTLYQAGRDLINGLINGIKDMAGNLAGAVGGAISGAVGDIPGAHTVLKTLHVPGFASGGVIPGAMGAPQLILGHGGEVVLNQEQQAGVARAMSSSSGGNTYITVQVNGMLSNERDLIVAVDKAAATHLARGGRLSGRGLVTA